MGGHSSAASSARCRAVGGGRRLGMATARHPTLEHHLAVLLSQRAPSRRHRHRCPTRAGGRRDTRRHRPALRLQRRRLRMACRHRPWGDPWPRARPQRSHNLGLRGIIFEPLSLRAISSGAVPMPATKRSGPEFRTRRARPAG
jgi:hypothetical protein